MDPFAAGSVYEQQNPSDDGQAWWFKWLIKSAAVILGFVAFVLGLVTAISISPFCIIAGLILMASSVLVLALEVPICFSFVEFLRPVTAFSEGRPHWQKTAIYMIPPIIVIALCHDVAPVLGSLCIFGVAALYFMLTIGKKAPLDEMRNRAAVPSQSKQDLTNEQIP
jgi:hypothetical protein